MALLFRAICWATLIALGITGIFMWRASPESGLTWRVVSTFFGIAWGLSFIPSVLVELLTAHLRADVGGPDS
jgi:hypothetical protein